LITIPVHVSSSVPAALSKNLYWFSLHDQVPCEVTSVDDLLGMQSFREDLRYLQLLSDRSMDLAPAIKTLIGVRMKRKREYWEGVNRGEILSVPDLEVPYHPIVVALFKAGSADCTCRSCVHALQKSTRTPIADHTHMLALWLVAFLI
jgi:hypothetical protein